MSYNLNPTGLFSGPDESGTTSANSHPYTFLDESESITLGTGESGIYIPLSNLENQLSTAKADEQLETSDYRYIIWAIVDAATVHQEAMDPEPAGLQLVKNPLFGEGDGITQLYKQKYFFDGSSLKIRDADDDPFA